MAGFRSGWGGSFTYEPLDRFKESEQERAKFLAGKAVGQSIQRAAAQVQQRQLTQIPQMRKEEPRPSNGGGFLGSVGRGIDRVTPDALESPAKAAGSGAMFTLGATQKYVGAPIAGVLTGRLGAPQQTAPDGTTFRGTGPIWEPGELGNLGRGLKKVVTQNPRDTYFESKRAWEEGQRDPEMPAWMRDAGDTVSDPLILVGPGAVKGALKFAPAAVRASKGARFAGFILEDPTRVRVGSALGGVLLPEAARQTGHEELAPAARLVGSIAGGVGGGLTSLDAPRLPDVPVNRATPAVQNMVAESEFDKWKRILPDLSDREITQMVKSNEGRRAAVALEEWFVDGLIARNPQIGKEELLAFARKTLADPHEREIMEAEFAASRAATEAAAARARGDAKTPFRENRDRVGADAESIARGRQALISRINSEKSKKGISPEMADSAKWFIRELPERYVARLGSSYVKNGDGNNVAGTYRADADVEDGIIRIIKRVANNNPEPERVIIHEIGHHLEQFVDDADYQALRSQWEREMGTGGGILPGSGKGGQMLVDDAQPVHDTMEADLKKTRDGRYEENPVAMTPENYRYQGGFGEWFAENIADRALRDYADDAIDVGPWKRAWQSVQEFANTVYRWLLRRGEKDAAERVYRNIMEGKYGESTRGVRDQSSIQNMAGTPDPESKGPDDFDAVDFEKRNREFSERMAARRARPQDPSVGEWGYDGRLDPTHPFWAEMEPPPAPESKGPPPVAPDPDQYDGKEASYNLDPSHPFYTKRPDPESKGPPPVAPAGIGRAVTQTIRNEDLVNRPDQFQARNTSPGKPYNEAKVQEIVAKYDPNQMTSGLVVRDKSTGELVVVSGHHRQEVLKRVNEPAGEWRVIDGDLNDPAQLDYFKKLADYENTGVASMDLVENVKLFRRAKLRGEKTEDAYRQMRNIDTKTARNYLEAISELPQDIIEKADEARMPVQNLGMIAKAAKTYGWDENDIRAIFRRYGPGGAKAGTTATEIESSLRRMGQSNILKEMRDTGFSGADWEATRSSVFDALDEFDRIDGEFKAKKAALSRAIRDAASRDTANARAYVKDLRDELETLEVDRKLAEEAFTAARKKAAAGAVPLSEGEWITHKGEPFEVIAVKGDAARIRSAAGEEEWLQTGADFFGVKPSFSRTTSPVAQAADEAPTMNMFGEEPAAAIDAAAPSTSLPSGEDVSAATVADSGGAQTTPSIATTTAAGSSPPASGGAPATANTGAQPKIDLFNTLSYSGRVKDEWADTQFGKGFLKNTDAVRARGRQAIERGARKTAAAIGGEKFDKNVKADQVDQLFTVKERTRIYNMISSYTEWADELFAKIENTGLKLKQDASGDFRMPNGKSFEDMMERATPEGQASYAALTPEQRTAVDKLVDWNEELNANLRYHSGTNLKWDALTKAYFPRMSVGVDGKPRVRLSGPDGSPSVGSTQGFEQARTQATWDEGVANGIDYANPREAFKSMTNAKLRAAFDEYLAGALKPMGKTKKELDALVTAGHSADIGVDYIQLPRDIAPALQGRYFEPETAARIQKALTDDPIYKFKLLREFNRVATPLRATADLSAFGQQGAAMLFRHPLKAPVAMAKVLGSVRNRAIYDKMIEAESTNLREHMKHGLHWVSDDLPASDYGWVKRGVSDKPGLKQVGQGYNAVASFSNKTFGRYMNVVRLTFANDAYERLAKMKSNLSPEDYRREYIGSMNAVNRLSGFTGRMPTSIEKDAWFAPRYFSAAIEQINAAVTKGGMEGSIARGHIGRMVAFGAGIAYAVNTARGYETEWDPRDSNFMRIRNVGGLDVSMMGTYDTLFRAVAGTFGGDPKGDIGPDITKLWKLAEGKMSPGVKFLYEPLIKRSTYSGEPLDVTSPKGFVKAAGLQAIAALPFSAQNALDSGVIPAIKERSLEPLKDALPGEAASFFGTTNSPVTPTEKRNWRRDKIAAKQTKDGPAGRTYDQLSGTEKSIVNEDPEVVTAQADADTNTLTRDDDRSKNEEARISADIAVKAATARLDKEEIAGSEFRAIYHDIQMEQKGARNVLKQMSNDKEVEEWYGLYDIATREDKSVDYDMLDSLQTAFKAKHPNIDTKIDAITGTRDNETMRDFRVAQAQAKEYYALPAYQGLSKEDSDIAAPILKMVARLTGNDQAMGYRDALNYLVRIGYIDQAQSRIAFRAQRAGPSPERKAYALAHPEFARFYKDSVQSLNGVTAPAIGSAPSVSRVGGSSKKTTFGPKFGTGGPAFKVEALTAIPR